MRRKDRYKSFTQLSQHERENVDFRILVDERPCRIGILAPHGGSIERATSQIARSIAGEEYALYRFIGLKKRRSGELHITSINYDEPVGCRFASQYETLVTIHGCTGENGIVYVGGLNEKLKEDTVRALLQADFCARLVINQNGLAGRDPRNICNRGKTGQGLQLELDSALRRSMFARAKGPLKHHPTEAFTRFVLTIRKVLVDYE